MLDCTFALFITIYRLYYLILQCSWLQLIDVLSCNYYAGPPEPGGPGGPLAPQSFRKSIHKRLLAPQSFQGPLVVAPQRFLASVGSVSYLVDFISPLFVS